MKAIIFDTNTWSAKRRANSSCSSRTSCRSGLKLLPDEKLFARLVGKYNCYLAETLAYGTPQSLFCRIIKYLPGRCTKSWPSLRVLTLLRIWEVTPVHPVATLGSMSTRGTPGTEECLCKEEGTCVNDLGKGLSYKCLLQGNQGIGM